MNDRPTPETDAFSVKFKSVCGSKAWVPTDICRRFERERDEAREKVERQKKEIVRLNGATNHAGGTPLKIALGERDKLNADLEEISSKLVVAMRERDKAREDATNYYAKIGELERERDEARERAANWESSSDAMERAGAEQARRADENREWALRAERERDEARKEAEYYKARYEQLKDQHDLENAKLGELAKRAIDDLGWFHAEGSDRLRLQLDQIKEGGK